MAKLTYLLIIERDKKHKALADLGLRLTEQDLSVLMVNMIDLIPAEFLTLLAEKWSMTGYDGWLLAESEEAKRKLIKNAVNLHRHKGTPWAIREVIRQLGFGEVILQEGLFGKVRDGSFTRNGNYYHGDKSKWAHYRVILNRPITNDQADLLRKTLQVFAPARCVLASLDYQAVALRHNGKAVRDGMYNRGAA